MRNIYEILIPEYLINHKNHKYFVDDVKYSFLQQVSDWSIPTSITYLIMKKPGKIGVLTSLTTMIGSNILNWYMRYNIEPKTIILVRKINNTLDTLKEPQSVKKN